jgi:two-component system sensor histidine kinase BaeS
MSFPVRMLALVLLVAALATGVTGYLTYRVAADRLANSEPVYQADVDLISRTLTEDGLTNGDWLGVGTALRGLSDSTGRRIRLTDAHGVVLADSDILDGRAPRAPKAPVAALEPRPQITFNLEWNQEKAVTMQELDIFRLGVERSRCLRRAGIAVTVSPGPHQVPRLAAAATASPSAVSDALAGCAAESWRDAGRNGLLDMAERKGDRQAIYSCQAGLSGCLQQAFAGRTASFTAEPAVLYVGFVGDEPTIPTTSALAALASVMCLAGFGTATLSRRALRPIRMLTAAVRHLGGGNLDRRVPVQGRDSVAELSRSFNEMATALQQTEKRQRQQVAEVAHELRSPLANLRAYLEGLTDGVIPPDPELFATLQDEAIRQQRMIDDLQYASTDAARLDYRRVTFDLGALATACGRAHRQTAAAAGLRLIVGDGGTLPVHGDPDRICQAVSNVLGNAVRYTPAGGVVELRAYREGATVCVVVRDSGVGISEADLPKVFDRMWRSDDARNTVSGGSGLGLAITRQIVDDHGGRVLVSSRWGVGTAFTIVLPSSAPALEKDPPRHDVPRSTDGNDRVVSR